MKGKIIFDMIYILVYNNICFESITYERILSEHHYTLLLDPPPGLSDQQRKEILLPYLGILTRGELPFGTLMPLGLGRWRLRLKSINIDPFVFSETSLRNLRDILRALPDCVVATPIAKGVKLEALFLELGHKVEVTKIYKRC